MPPNTWILYDEGQGYVENETGLTCHLENDVNCAGLGELWLGANSDRKLVSMITVGTGIGACLIPGMGS